MYKPVIAILKSNNERYAIAVQFVHQIVQELLVGEKIGTEVIVYLECEADLNVVINRMNSGDIWTLIREKHGDTSKIYSYHVAGKPSTMIKVYKVDNRTLKFCRVSPVSVIANMDDECVVANEYAKDRSGLRRFKYYTNRLKKIADSREQSNKVLKDCS